MNCWTTIRKVFLFGMILLAICFLQSCGLKFDFGNLQTPSAKSGGHIVFIQETSPGVKRVYLQKMAGITPLGNAYDITDPVYVTSNTVRYPKLSRDGSLLYYVAKDNGTSPIDGSEIDNLIVANRDGSFIYMHGATIANSFPCVSLSYPELIWFNTDDTSSGYVSYRIDARCVTQNGMEHGVSWTVWNVATDGSKQVDSISTQPAIYGPQLVEVTNVDKTSQSPNSVDPDKKFGVYYSNDGDMFWHMVAQPYSPDNCSTSSWLDFNGKMTGPVYVSSSDYLAAGHPAGLIPIPTPLKKAYAPSISASGVYLLFNSEAFTSDVNRNEELFAIRLKSAPCYWFQFEPLSLNARHEPSIIQLTNGPGNEYANFTANPTLPTHAYIMWRHNDPTNGGQSTLYIAPDINSPPVRLHPSQSLNEFEADWFYVP